MSTTTQRSAKQALKDSRLQLAHCLTVYGPQDPHTQRVAQLVRLCRSLVKIGKVLR